MWPVPQHTGSLRDHIGILLGISLGHFCIHSATAAWHICFIGGVTGLVKQLNTAIMHCARFNGKISASDTVTFGQIVIFRVVARISLVCPGKLSRTVSFSVPSTSKSRFKWRRIAGMGVSARAGPFMCLMRSSPPAIREPKLPSTSVCYSPVGLLPALGPRVRDFHLQLLQTENWQ